MQLKRILSHRKTELWPSWQLVYEWEDIFSESLGIPIVHISTVNIYIFKILRRLGLASIVQWLDLNRKESGYSLYFIMYTDKYFNYPLVKNTIPLIIDFYLKSKDLEEFYQAYRNCQYVLISSLEVFNFLKENNCPLNIKHVPLSLSDKYRLTELTNFKKDIDVLFAGRKNPVLWDYIKKYAQENPDFEYVYQIDTNGSGTLLYESNKKGILGEFLGRDEYINLIKSAKISFYATPGMDGNENKTNGFNQVTPRFLELLSSGCLLIGRYPVNADTDYYELNEYCPNVSSYSEFKSILNTYLESKSYPVEKYVNYLNQHYTSVRAREIKNLISQE